MIFNTIRDSKTSAIPTIGLLLISGLNHFFKTGKFSTGFAQSLASINFFDLLLNFMESLSLNQSEFFPPLLELLCSIIHNNDILLRSFADIFGFKKCIQLFSKSDMPFAAYYTGILYKSLSNGFKEIVHSQGLIALIELPPDVPLDQFIIIWNDVVQLCQISNFKNLEKCRKARLFRWMLENLEIFVDHRLLPEAIDFMITLLQYHANFEDVKLLVSQLKANETHIPWKHDLILQIMKKATDYRLKVSQSDFFIFLTNESKFLIPSIPSTFETITNGYTFTIGLNFHDWNLQSRPNVDVVIATLSWSEVVCHTSIIMKNKSLFLEFKSNDELISVEVVDFQFKMETWYTIIYTHQVGMFNVSNEVLYINGKPMWKGTFPYPTADYDMDLGIGLSTGQDVFPAYISSFALFNLAIPLEIVQTLHLNKEVSLTIGSELYGFQLLTSYQQPIVFCHPLGIKDVNTIYNISSKDDPFVSTGIPIVKIVPVSTRSFSDALQSAGSLEILFPLLTQIGIPVVLHNDAAVQRYILTQQERVVQILLLINSIIAQSPFHRNRYIRTKGPKLVSLLLQQISPEYLSTGVFDAIQELRLIGGSTPGFVKMIDDHILFEPQIWSRVNTQLQTLYFEKVSGLNKVFPDISVTTQQLSFWMDSVEQFYIRDTKAPWEYIRNLTYYICTNSDAPRFSESLWCCIHSPDGVILYQIFEQLQFHNPKFYQAILDLNGVELIFRLLQSVHESVRLTGLSLLEGIIINDSGTNAKLRKAMLDVKPGVWVKVLSQFPFTSSTYYKLLSITFDTILKLTGDSIYIDISKISKTLEIKRTDFLKVILDILGTAETIDAHVEVRIHHDLQYLLTSSISLARQVRDSASLHSIMEYLRRYLSTEREPITQHIQNLIQILVLLTLGGKEADQLLTNVMSDILTACLLLFPQQTGMHIIRQFLDILMSRLKVLILRNLGDDEQQRILDGLNIIDEIFFYHKDIFLALETEYGFALQNFNALMEIADAMPPSKSRRPSVSPDMVFQPCYPFDEWTELAVKYSRLIESVLRSNIVKQQKFSLFPFQQRQDSLIVLAVRIILASLTNCDRPTWNITLMQLSDMMDEGDFSKEALSQKFAYYILGSLYDASLLGSEILVYPAILQALELWGRLLIGSEKSLDRETLEKATSSLFDLEEFLKSEVWLNIYNNHLYHATRSVENEWIASVVPIVRRYKAVAHFLLTSTSRELQAVDSSEVSAMERLNREATVKAEIRKKRLSDRLCDYELDNRELTKIWHFCAQEVMYDGRIWSNAKLTQFYKLDITENSLRMRLRLAPHSDGEDHEIASQKRDQRRGSVVAKTQAPFQSLPDRKKILFKRLQTLQLDTGLVSEESLTHNDETIRIALEVNPDEDSTTGYDSQIETCLLSIECEIILYLTSVRGRIEVTTSHLRFFPDIVPQQKDAMTPITTTASSSVMVHLQELRIFAEHKRPLTELTNVFFRRYKMRNSAIEAFFNDGQNFFFSFFGNEQEADTIRKSLVNLLLKIPNMSFNCFNSSNLSVSLAKSDYTNRWIRREISNFEYLMALNTFSGRSYNDLTQYPVFPWILSDYTSKKLDLKDPSIYRDLSKPIGALTESRLQYFLERYKSFEDPSGEIEKFLYGSHYSSSVSVMFYLIRLEPFTSFHISLQGGKFDHADRQFHSMASLWKGVTTSTSDVKELIPEFFYLPEFLRNMNGFDLGKTQSGDMLNDVVLPPWASTPEDFIRIHRDALESDYVSDNLHHWIDLIWGYKQRGEQAVLAHNVFYYLTYEGSVNLDLIVDPMERKSIEDQIHHFGQTPSQLFNIPHPKRDPSPTTTSQDLSYSISSTNLGGNFDPACIFLISNTHFNHIFLANLGIKVLQYKYISSISSEGIKSVGVDFMNNVESRGMNNIQFSSFVKPHDQVMALTPNGKHLFVSGVFDYSFKLFNIEGTALRFVDRVFEHLDVVTCLCLSSTGEWLVTGSRDTTVRLWKIRYMNDRCVVTRGAMKIFYGHHEPVTSVLVNSENQIIVSASDDGKILVHPLHHSMSPITINPRIMYPHCSILKLCHFPIDGTLLVLCSTNNCESKLLKYSINGRLLKNEAVGTVIDTAAVSNSGKYIYLAIKNGVRVLDGER
ncbi:hypothetical protein BC833DRAFT_49211 [Globomyces pollinis-pini]|nr:hypothetical protein BC833DRAFT_49211 [Globomyces pollinis-pini]